jgi:hypothetical protein
MKFYHVINAKRGSGITVAAEVVEENNGKTNTDPYLVECAVSYCAPCESNFSRPKGRTIALSRLSSSKAMPDFKRFAFRTNDQQGLKTQVLRQLSTMVPMNWAKSIVDRELARLQAVQLEKLFEVSVETAAE